MPDLKDSRPDLRQKNFFCSKCQRSVQQLAHFGMHYGAAPGQGGLLSGEGEILAMASCHGQDVEIKIMFSKLRQLIEEQGKDFVVTLFDESGKNVSPLTYESQKELTA